MHWMLDDRPYYQVRKYTTQVDMLTDVDVLQQSCITPNSDIESQTAHFQPPGTRFNLSNQ
ncbi:uncharacterized protein RSE6_11450 [Rhynchosporium secalis]|uniref:Uncharacterized protein n=1 Tax=Rhynchosporium secalis TaxID=38038 RepID=A0A1E1MMZ9_RHYSE|nr:uncharacterized protein RSE6_11450 [Rhynchosporium secalis]